MKAPCLDAQSLPPKGIPITEIKVDSEGKPLLLNKGSDLCFYSPATGGYGIPRVACLVPGSHVLFVAPQGCGRHGLVAAYLHGRDRARIHALHVQDEAVSLGSHLDQVANAARFIVDRYAPSALTIVYSCIDDLLGSDFDLIASDVQDACGLPVQVSAMNPIRSEGSLPPLPRALRTVYSFLEPSKQGDVSSSSSGADGQPAILNLCGIFSNVHPSSEAHAVLARAGYRLANVADCATYEEFQALSASRLNLVAHDAAAIACDSLHDRLGMESLRFPLHVLPSLVARSYERLEKKLEVALSWQQARDQAMAEIGLLASRLKGLRVSVGSSHLASPFELARFLTECGMRVESVYANALSRTCMEQLSWLQQKAPQIVVLPPESRRALFMHETAPEVDVAVGLDAAYYSNCTRYADIGFELPLFGFQGGVELLRMLVRPCEVSDGFEAALTSSSLVV